MCETCQFMLCMESIVDETVILQMPSESVAIRGLESRNRGFFNMGRSTKWYTHLTFSTH